MFLFLPLVKSKLKKIDEIIGTSDKLRKSANLNLIKTTTNKDFSKSILKNINTTKYGTGTGFGTGIGTGTGITFMDTLQSQLSNTYNTNTLTNNNINIINDDFLMVKNSDFKNEKEFNKHLKSKCKDKSINSIMNHIVKK